MAAPLSLAAAGPLTPDNPLAAPSDLPYGLPDFASIRTEHLAPALAAGLAEQCREWREIGGSPEAPTPENTLAALERSGCLLGRATGVLRTLVAAGGGEELRALEAELAPVLAAHRDALHLDPAIRTRLDALHAAHEAGELPLDPETVWVLHLHRTAFTRAGARLGQSERARLRRLNTQISVLETSFAQAAVAAAEAGAVEVEEPELAGLPDDVVVALARAARERGRRGYLVPLQLPTDQGILALAADRDLRRRVMAASLARGWGEADPDTDTRETVLRLARLRHERARLLGYPHHAAYVAQDGTAGTAEAVADLLAGLAPPARRNAEREAAEIRTELAEDLPGVQLEPSDWAFYAARVRRRRHDVDDAALRPYLEARRVLRDGVLFAAERLYGLRVVPRPDLQGHAPGAMVLEVREEDGSGLGLCLLDLVARPGKRGGAWMDSLAQGSRLLGDAPVVTVNLNVDPVDDGSPTLLTWDETTTLFHEFGHALHGLLSDVHYPSTSGTSVPRDVVEYPSQLNEVWATHPEVLARFARHHQTGRPVPPGTGERLGAAQRDGAGFATLEYLQAALLDQAWHGAGPELPATADDVARFEEEVLTAAGVRLDAVPPRYRSTYFAHAFGGGYDAAYYSYVWSEVLDADTADWFAANGGLDRAAGQRFRAAVLGRGHSRDPRESFRALRGRDPQVEPLLRRRGLLARNGPAPGR